MSSFYILSVITFFFVSSLFYGKMTQLIMNEHRLKMRGYRLRSDVEGEMHYTGKVKAAITNKK